MAVIYTTAQDRSIASGSWTDINCSVPSSATGVIILVINEGSVLERQFILRKKGSSDSHTGYLRKDTHTQVFVGVDVNGYCQGYVNHTDVKFKIIGYFNDEAVFFTHGIGIPTTGDEVWNDTDLSGSLPVGTKAVILFQSQKTWYGFRKNGSSDNRYCLDRTGYGVIVGVDEDRKIEVRTMQTSSTSVFIYGYLTVGEFPANSTDKSLAITGSWQDITVSGAEACVVEVFDPTYDRLYGIRKKGSGDDFYNNEAGHAWIVTGLDGFARFEGKIGDVSTDFYLTGVLEASGTAVLTSYDGQHKHTAEVPALVQDHILTVSSPQHGHTATGDILLNGIESHSSSHAHTAGTVYLDYTGVDAASTLPALTATATGFLGATGDVTFPAFTIVAGTGNCLAVTLPGITSTGVAAVHPIGDGEVVLSTLEMNSLAGAKAAIEFPTLEITVASSTGKVGYADFELPGITLESSAGAAATDIKLSLEVDATGTVHVIASLDKSLPSLRLEGYGSADSIGLFDSGLPALKVAGITSRESLGNGAIILPSMLALSGSLCGEIGSLNQAIADLTCLATSYYSPTGDFDVSLPGLNINQSKGQASGRFTDYVLRYVD